MATASVFQSDVGRVAQLVGLPPRLLLALPGQLSHPVAFGLVGHAIQVAQVTDIPGCRNAVTSLHAAQLAHREHQSLGGLLHGEALFRPKRCAAGRLVRGGEPWGCALQARRSRPFAGSQHYCS